MSGRALTLTLRDLRKTKLAKVHKTTRCHNEREAFLTAADNVESGEERARESLASAVKNLVGGMQSTALDVRPALPLPPVCGE